MGAGVPALGIAGGTTLAGLGATTFLTDSGYAAFDLGVGETAKTSVFWSGPGTQAAAEAWAASNGGQTLTVAANDSLADIETASTDFAASASGNVDVVQNGAGVSVRSRWARFEYPTPMINLNVPSITYHIIDSTGSITDTFLVS